MFGTAKPLASLSSGLLARKGEARPAMRPQTIGAPAQPGDALGWNDMGDTPAPIATPLPEVLVAREALKHEIEAPASATAGKRAAFTLRLDAQRHLRLRLAAASSNRSAQALVTQALDHFLDTMPEVAALAAHMPPRDPR